MGRNATVITKNRYFARKIALELAPLSYEVRSSEVIFEDPAELLLIDCDTVDAREYPRGAILFSKNGGEGVVSIPFPIGEVCKRLSGAEDTGLILNGKDHTVTLFGTVTRLTGIEYALLLRLVLARGEVVSKEELRSTLFEGEATPGAVSVYIHYLRQKLELGGEKIILATRGVGYAIAKKYLPREEPVC